MMSRMAANKALASKGQIKPVRNTTILKQITEESYNMGSNKGDMKLENKDVATESMASHRTGQKKVSPGKVRNLNLKNIDSNKGPSRGKGSRNEEPLSSESGRLLKSLPRARSIHEIIHDHNTKQQQIMEQKHATKPSTRHSLSGSKQKMARNFSNSNLHMVSSTKSTTNLPQSSKEAKPADNSGSYSTKQIKKIRLHPMPPKTNKSINTSLKKISSKSNDLINNSKVLPNNNSTIFEPHESNPNPNQNQLIQQLQSKNEELTDQIEVLNKKL